MADQIKFIKISQSDYDNLGNYDKHALYKVETPNLLSLTPGYYSRDRKVYISWEELENMGLDITRNCSAYYSKENADHKSGTYFFEYNNLEGTLVVSPSVSVIGHYQFTWCDKITNVVLPNSVEQIGVWAFDYSSIQKLWLSNNITNFQPSLTGVTFLQSINSDKYGQAIIPEGVTWICQYFAYNSRIDELNVPASVNLIFVPVNARLSSIKVDEYNERYDSRSNCNAIIETATNTLVAGCKNTIIPQSVLIIGASAFEAYPESSIVIPNSVTRINQFAFKSSNIESITIPNSVTILGKGVFSNCKQLRSVVLSDALTFISHGYALFENCDNLQQISYKGIIYTSETKSDLNQKLRDDGISQYDIWE